MTNYCRFLKDKLQSDAKSVEDEYKAIQCESMQCLARECAEVDVVVEWRTEDRCRKCFHIKQISYITAEK